MGDGLRGPAGRLVTWRCSRAAAPLTPGATSDWSPTSGRAFAVTSRRRRTSPRCRPRDSTPHNCARQLPLSAHPSNHAMAHSLERADIRASRCRQRRAHVNSEEPYSARTRAASSSAGRRRACKPLNQGTWAGPSPLTAGGTWRVDASRRSASGQTRRMSETATSRRIGRGSAAHTDGRALRPVGDSHPLRQGPHPRAPSPSCWAERPELPAPRASSQTVRSRLRAHRRGDAYGFTLRLTVGYLPTLKALHNGARAKVVFRDRVIHSSSICVNSTALARTKDEVAEGLLHLTTSLTNTAGATFV
jgi:hypothetical protein